MISSLGSTIGARPWSFEPGRALLMASLTKATCDHSLVTYDIISDIICDWYDISSDVIKGLGKLHLGGYQVAKHKRKVQKQYPDAITRQMLPGMTLDIHVVEVGSILRGHLEERR